jgi:hypothetical protein
MENVAFSSLRREIAIFVVEESKRYSFSSCNIIILKNKLFSFALCANIQGKTTFVTLVCENLKKGPL